MWLHGVWIQLGFANLQPPVAAALHDDIKSGRVRAVLATCWPYNLTVRQNGR